MRPCFIFAVFFSQREWRDAPNPNPSLDWCSKRAQSRTAAPAEEQQSPGIRDVLGVYFTAKKCQKSVLFGQGFAGDR